MIILYSYFEDVTSTCIIFSPFNNLTFFLSFKGNKLLNNIWGFTLLITQANLIGFIYIIIIQCYGVLFKELSTGYALYVYFRKSII